MEGSVKFNCSVQPLGKSRAAEKTELLARLNTLIARMRFIFNANDQDFVYNQYFTYNQDFAYKQDFVYNKDCGLQPRFCFRQK